LPSFGEKLRLEREKRKISLDQISSSTKIGARMLQALEEDKFSQLPGGIFNKGFVRAYARAVGLDEDQTIADYLQASGDAPRPELVTRDGGVRDAAEETASRAAARDTARHEENRIRLLEATSDEPSRPLPWGVFAVVLLIIALALSLWSHRRREQERLALHPAAKTAAQSKEPSPPNTAPGQSGTSPASTTPATSGAQTNSSSSGSGATGAAGAGAAPSSAPGEKLPSGAPQTAPKPDQTSATSPPLMQSSAPISPGEFEVLIHAREQSWVSVSIDGKSAGSEVLEAGSERTFHARSRVFVKAGNSGALDFQLDGKKLNIGGEFGEVKSVTIGHAGVIPTPAEPPANP
jgi:cytoskeletal protein RodZ